MSSQAEAPAQVGGVSLDGFDTVGCHFEPGISATPFPGCKAAGGTAVPFSPINGWKLPRRRAQYGLSCVLTAKARNTPVCLSVPEKEKTILKLEPIDPPDDGSGSVSFSRQPGGEDAKEFMQPFEEQASAQRGEDAKELMRPFEE